jgi:hypothetical protein
MWAGSQFAPSAGAPPNPGTGPPSLPRLLTVKVDEFQEESTSDVPGGSWRSSFVFDPEKGHTIVLELGSARCDPLLIVSVELVNERAILPPADRIWASDNPAAGTFAKSNPMGCPTGAIILEAQEKEEVNLVGG